MKYPHLIILYGRFGDKLHDKQQAMIYGESTCMYREMARAFGEIIYLCPQNTRDNYSKSITNTPQLKYHLLGRPDSIVWSIKYDPTQQKDKILEQIPNKKVYYSCCSYNTTNSSCNISLVDTPERVKDNAVLWVKGKDPDFWKPQGSKKVFDYCMIGKRGDKNEVWFIDQLTAQVKEKRNVMWIGGQKHAHKIGKSHHNIVCTEFSGPEGVRNYIDLCKVGVILSEIPAEGFPQSFLEMTMMGVPVVYMGPYNEKYMLRGVNMVRCTNKSASCDISEAVLSAPETGDCREHAINNYSLEKSYESILRGLNVRY